MLTHLKENIKSWIPFEHREKDALVSLDVGNRSGHSVSVPVWYLIPNNEETVSKPFNLSKFNV